MAADNTNRQRLVKSDLAKRKIGWQNV